MVICIADSSVGLNVKRKIKGGRFKRRKCSSTGASFADIPEELQIDIFSRLPAKLLSRCKCVSKHWDTTLTIKAFLLRYFASYDKHPIKLGFVVCSRFSGENTILSLKLNDDNTPKSTTVTVTKPIETHTSILVGNYCSMNTGGTEITEEIIRARDVYLSDFRTSKYSRMSNICNDLICLSIDFSKRVGLLNIRTLDFIRLPAVTKSEFASGFWYSLGFDPVNKVFKVLCIYFEINEGFNTKAATLTVGSKYWNPIEYKSSYSHGHCANNFCLDGVIYWVHQNTKAATLTVVAFDLNREAFRDYELLVTHIEDVETFGYYLTSLKGYPTLFSWKIKSDENHEIQQLTLFNHKNPNASWATRNFISPSFPLMFYCSEHRMCVRVAGGSILLQYSNSIQGSVKFEEQDDTKSSCYILYNLEKYAI